MAPVPPAAGWPRSRQVRLATSQNAFQKSDHCPSPAAFASKTNHRRSEEAAYCNERVKVGVKCGNDTATLVELECGIRRDSLVRKKLEGNGPGIAHAAGISEASSAKFAAANLRGPDPEAE